MFKRSISYYIKALFVLALIILDIKLTYQWYTSYGFHSQEFYIREAILAAFQFLLLAGVITGFRRASRMVKGILFLLVVVLILTYIFV